MQHKSLRDYLGNPSDCEGSRIWGPLTSVTLSQAISGTCLGGRVRELSGRSVLLLVKDQIVAAVAILELDGIVRRLVICPPDVPREHIQGIVSRAEVDAIVLDQSLMDANPFDCGLCVLASSEISSEAELPLDRYTTEWVLLTSGTTGTPKLLVHDLESLAGTIIRSTKPDADVVWGTFYDIRRYGGLQILLRALLGRRSLVLSDGAESPGDYLLRLGLRGVTHLTGTPSHWRRAVMSPSLRAISPRYIRLSGEIADQAILNVLKSIFTEVPVVHAFASTESGVNFEVSDGLEGFPASIIGVSGEVEIQVKDGSLRMRSRRTASRFIGNEQSVLIDPDGFVDTGDMVEQRGDRYFFLGRRSGVINVGGLKVFPEEIETLINRHPAVSMSCVRSRRNPITGALVVADVVLKDEAKLSKGRHTEIEKEILEFCKDALPRYKVPAALRFVPALAVAETGKLVRTNA